MSLLDLEAQERTWCDSALFAVMWLHERHRDQLELHAPTSIGDEQFTELLVYILALRDWPQSPDFPAIEQRPAPPPWLAGQTQ